MGDETGPAVETAKKDQTVELSEGIPAYPQDPTVGRIVHFYTKDTTKQFNALGEGPYPAIVTEVSGGSTANLKVLPAFGAPYDEGSVSHKSRAAGHARWWEWPPLV